jgi:NADPH2:quinone reductase
VAPEDVAGAGPFDVILELVGGPNLATDLDVVALRGRVAVIGVGAGSRAEIDLRRLMDRRAVLSGSTLRSRSLEDKAHAARRVEAQVLPLVAAGAVTVPVAAAFPLDQVAAAYERFRAGAKFGKIVLVLDQDAGAG